MSVRGSFSSCSGVKVYGFSGYYCVAGEKLLIGNYWNAPPPMRVIGCPGNLGGATLSPGGEFDYFLSPFIFFFFYISYCGSM